MMMPPFEVRENRFGKCIHATERIKRDTVICSFTGQPMLYEETKKLGKAESFALQTSPNFYLFLDEPARFFNHSCEPSCGLGPDLRLKALRDVARGEELNYDYSTTMMERDWHLRCHCNKPGCRGIVTDFDRLPGSAQQYYIERNVVQTYILDILKSRGRK